jgi:hypothetical protein
MTLAAVTGGEQQDQKASMRRKERRLLYSTFRWEYISKVQKLEYGWNMAPLPEIRTKGSRSDKTCGD